MIRSLWLWMVMMLAASPVCAENREQSTSTAPERPSIVEPVMTSPATTPESPAAKPKAPEEAVRAQLDGTRWMLELTPLSGAEKVKAQKDTVTFDAKQVSSERLSKTGYPPSNYTLTIGDDGVPVWETMQTKEGEGVAFWRGEFHGTTMRGVLSKHPVKGVAEDFSFTGQEVGGKAVRSSNESTTGASDIGAPPSSNQSKDTVPQASSKKKKRKGH